MFLGVDRPTLLCVFFFIAYDAENGGTQTIANFHDNEIDSVWSVSMASRLF